MATLIHEKQKTMKYGMFLLLVGLLCCNAVNSQVGYEIETQKCIRGVAGESSPSGSFCHIVENKTKQNLVIFFIEEENDALSDVKFLRRKLYRKYGDFYFFMIEWEANMSIEKSPTVTPDLFVKILKPEEKLKVVVPFANDKEEQIASEVSRHLLVCADTLFSSDEIGMPHFMENLQLYDIAYDKSEVVISADTFKSFILGPKKKIGYIWKHAETMETDSFYCRVCGLYLDYQPGGEGGRTPSYDICPRCVKHN